MKCVKIVVFIALFICSLACSKEDKNESKIELLTVAPYHVTWYPPVGSAVFEHAYRVWDSFDKEFTIQYIQDFADKYEEGYEYVIRVRVVTPKEPEWDQIGSTYYLLEIISKTMVDE